MAYSSLTIELPSGILRTYGGNKSDVRLKTSWYKSVTYEQFRKKHPYVSEDEFNQMKVYGVDEPADRSESDCNKFKDIFMSYFPLALNRDVMIAVNRFNKTNYTPNKYMRVLLADMEKFNFQAPAYYSIKLYVNNGKVYPSMRYYYISKELYRYDVFDCRYRDDMYTNGFHLVGFLDIERDKFSVTKKGAIAKAKRRLSKLIKDKDERKAMIKVLNNF